MLKIKLPPVLVGLACLMVVGCAGGQSRLADNSVGDLAPPDSITAVQKVVEDYRIGPQDRLSVAVYPARDMSMPSARVTADGSIMLPPLGALRAQGKTASELSREIEARLSECCLQRPQVVVQVEETVSQQITVTGAVKASNVYNLRGRVTLMQAIAMAGGLDIATANPKRVGVIRVTNGQRTGKIFNLEDIQAGRAEDPEIYGNDRIVVDTSNSKTAWRNVIQAIPLAGIFRPF